MRVEQKLSVNEIAERLAISKATIFYWVGDLPLGRKRRSNGQRQAADAVRAKYKALRDASYEAGLQSYSILIADPRFRDFVSLYLAEGYKRCRNSVAVGNSDPAIVKLCASWLERLSDRKMQYSLQYHADQDLDELRRFWGAYLDIDGDTIALQRKSNSNQLTGRTWRSRYGVLTVRVSDTYLRARLEAWMDCLRASWDVDLAA